MQDSMENQSQLIKHKVAWRALSNYFKGQAAEAANALRTLDPKDDLGPIYKAQERIRVYEELLSLTPEDMEKYNAN